MNVLIAGCGDVGTQLGLMLVTHGHEVTAIRRNSHKCPATFTRLAIDLTQTSDLSQLTESFDAVVYTAAADEHSPDAYQAAYLKGLINLVARLETTGLPERFIFTSSTGVYHQQDGSWVDEASETRPSQFSGKILLEAEQLIAQLTCPTIAVRLGGIYGPGRERLLHKVKAGSHCQANPPRYTNRIHSADCAAVLAHLLTLKQPSPCYLAVDHEPAPECEVYQWLAARLKAPTPVSETVNPVSAMQNKRCSNALLLASGYQFKYPTYKEGYRQLIGEMNHDR